MEPLGSVCVSVAWMGVCGGGGRGGGDSGGGSGGWGG